MYIEGALRTRKWQDQSGNDRYTTEIALQGFDAKLVMLDGPGGAGASGGGTGGGGRSSGGGANGAAVRAAAMMTASVEQGPAAAPLHAGQVPRVLIMIWTMTCRSDGTSFITI